MARRRDRGRKGGQPRGGPKGGRSRDDDRTPKRPRQRRHDRSPDRASSRREMLAKGRASQVGLDGKLRVEMEPLELELAARLSRGKGALVFTPRGDRLGAVESIIGTLDRPIAVVRVFPEMRQETGQVQGRELFMG